MKISFAAFVCSLSVAYAADCEYITPAEPMVQSLAGLLSVAFEGYKPSISRVEGDPMIKIMRYSSEPSVAVVDGKLVVSSSVCGTGGTSATTAPTSEETMDETSASSHLRSSTTMAAAAAALFSIMGGSGPGLAVASGAALASLLPSASAQSVCEDVVEVEIHGPVKTRTNGEVYMEDQILWTDYDGEPDSFHWRPDETWSGRVAASRIFQESKSGDIYNYRNKVLMGMAQTRVLNDPPSVTAKEDVVFDIPVGVVLPDTDEGIMMLSVLEMQALLRAGSLTSVQLTNIAFDMLDKYDAEFNMLEVELKDLALRVAGEADALFAAGEFVSAIQGIPFAVKDTYDVAGYATAYGSWEFMDNIVETESPLVTYAVQNYGVPLFKSSVPQMTWGTANYKGTVYSCLNGGYAAGPGGSGGSSIGSGAAVCLGVVPAAICEQTGSSCQSPAIGNGISTVIPAIGTFSRENNGLYSMESDRPGLLCRDIMSCAVFYNYMRGTSPGDPQSRDVPFSDPSKEDLSTYTIAVVDNSDVSSWPPGFDTPLKGQRGNVADTLAGLGANVMVKDDLSEIMTGSQLYNDTVAAGISNTQGFDWYWLNIETFFEKVFKYGSEEGMSYGPVWVGQNFNFDGGSPHTTHIGATAYAYLDSLWMFGYAAEFAMFPMMEEQFPDVVVHFGQSELAGSYDTNLFKRAGINTVHIPEFYWNTTDETFVDWAGSKPIEYYDQTTVSAAMITCESKKYEPVKAFAVCYQLQQILVPGGKLISPYIGKIQEAIRSGEHDLDCPYDWSNKRPGYLAAYPEDIRTLVTSKLGNIGNSRVCAGPDTSEEGPPPGFLGD